MSELQRRAFVEEGDTTCGWDNESQGGHCPLRPGLVSQDM